MKEDIYQKLLEILRDHPISIIHRAIKDFHDSLGEVPYNKDDLIESMDVILGIPGDAVVRFLKEEKGYDLDEFAALTAIEIEQLERKRVQEKSKIMHVIKTKLLEQVDFGARTEPPSSHPEPEDPPKMMSLKEVHLYAKKKKTIDDVADKLGTTFHVLLRQLGKNYDITYPELGQMSIEFAEEKFGDRYTQKILTSGKNLRLYTQTRQDHTLKPISGERIWEVCSRCTAVSAAASLAGMDLQSFKYRLSALGKTFKELHAIKNIEDAKTALGDKFEKPFQYVAAKRRYSASLFADEGEPKELGKSKTSPGGLAP